MLQEGSENISSSCDMLKLLQLSQTAICIDGAQYLSGCHPVSDLNYHADFSCVIAASFICTVCYIVGF